jgi:hypothetical protein
MTPETPDWAARKPTHRSHGRGRLRLSRAINARRRLNLPLEDGGETNPKRPAVVVPSFAYLIRPHD